MDKKEIKLFLHNKKGYLKEGSRRLRKVLLRKGFLTTISDCREAIKEVNKEIRTVQNQDFKNLKVLFYDIETSYNIVKAWSAGYNKTINHNDIIHEKKIICISYKWLGEDQVYSISWDKRQDDKFLLETFIDVMNEADVIVAHYGDRFDLPTIKARAISHNLSMFVDYKTVDTKKIASKKFKFNSNKLDYLASYFGFGSKIKVDMELWDDIILRKNQESLNKMIEYCEQDVVLLEKVYLKLVSWENPVAHIGTMNNLPKFTSPFTGGLNLEMVKEKTTKTGYKKFIMKDMDNGRYFEMSETNYNKFLESKPNK